MRISSPFVCRCVRIAMFGLLVLLLTACGTGGSANGSTSSGSTSALLPGTITEFTLSSTPTWITPGPDGNLWFVEFNNTTSDIGRITPGGKITRFAVPDVQVITPGPDGNLWFIRRNENQIGRITPTGTVTEFTVPTSNSDNSSGLYGITTGPDGNLWFTSATLGSVPCQGRMTPTGTFTEFPLPASDSNNSVLILLDHMVFGVVVALVY